MSASKIEWTEQTWNPVTGCTQVSSGCRHRYAERMALRLRAMAAPGYAGGFALTLHEDRLDRPLDRKKPTVYFVCSMADLFHPIRLPGIRCRLIRRLGGRAGGVRLRWRLRADRCMAPERRPHARRSAVIPTVYAVVYTVVAPR